MTAPWLQYGPFAIAALSLFATVVFGVQTRRTARRALELEQRQEERRDSRVDLSINASVYWPKSASRDRLLGFHVLATNPADRANSLVGAELHVIYSIDGVLTTVKVPYAAVRPPVPAPPGVDPITLPIRLGANDSLSGWLLFDIRGGLTGGWPIDRYDVVVRDVHGIEQAAQAGFLKEVSPDEAD